MAIAPNGGDPTTRLFFAIAPDHIASVRLDALARDVAERSGGRASAAATLHLTVVFVGSVADPVVDAIVDAGAAVAWRSCELALDTLGTFSRAGVAWAAPSRIPAELVPAQQTLVGALANRGVPTEARPWRPHVTLARRCTRTIDGPIEPPITWHVGRVILMASQLRADGPRYREIAGWPTG